MIEDSQRDGDPMNTPRQPFESRPVLVPFCDDSTLFFARRMRDCLHQAAPGLEVHMGLVEDINALSDRQMDQLLPAGPDVVIRGQTGFRALLLSGQYKALLTSRVYGDLDEQLRDENITATPDRPCVMAFLGGLDFFPQNGYFRRRNCDVVYLFPKSEMATFQGWSEGWSDARWQELGFGHPTFLAPQTLTTEDLQNRRDIYFFAQAISPSTPRGRLHMLRAMAAIARANPDRSVWVKLRHLPNENRQHVHRERFDYPGLLKRLPDVPENLKFTACTMDEALERAAIGITCTSTAAIDVLRAGVPCMVHLDFVDNYVDQLVAPMHKLFAGSGVVVSLEDMLHLRSPTPDPAWVEQMFCPRDLGQQVLDAVVRFNDRARLGQPEPQLSE